VFHHQYCRSDWYGQQADHTETIALCQRDTGQAAHHANAAPATYPDASGDIDAGAPADAEAVSDKAARNADASSDPEANRDACADADPHNASANADANSDTGADGNSCADAGSDTDAAAHTNGDDDASPCAY
jgi:hypothetical protein